MGLAQPLGLLLGGTIAVLVFFYLRERRRQSEVVPSLFLWQSLEEDPPRARHFHPDLLFLLQLLALTTLTLSVARPYRVDPTPTPIARHSIFVIDTTASTQAIDVAPSRFDALRGLANARLDAMSAGDQVAIIAAGARPELKQPFTADRDMLKLALTDLDATDEAGDPRAALSLAHQLQSDLDDARIFIFTDRNGAARVDERDNDLIVVGSSDDNVAISSLEVIQGPFDPYGKARIVVQVQSHTRRDKHVLLSVAVAGTNVLQQGFSLGPREGRTFVVDHAPAAGVVRAQIQAGDALPHDDVAFGWVRSGPAATIVLIAKASPFADTVASLAKRLGLELIRVETREQASTASSRGRRILVFDRNAPESWPSENALFLLPPRHNALFPVIDEIDDAEIIDWNAQHPIFASLQPLPALPLRRAQLLDPPPWAAPLLWSHSHMTTQPIAAAGVFNGHRYACLGIDLSIEGLFANDRIDRLLVFANTLAWLAPQGSAAVVTRAGHAIEVPEAVSDHACDDTARLCSRDGSVEPTQVGVVDLHRGDDSITVLTNFGGVAESDLSEDFAPVVAPARDLEGARSAPLTRRALAPWFFVAALALLVVEWWVWGRQVT